MQKLIIIVTFILFHSLGYAQNNNTTYQGAPIYSHSKGAKTNNTNLHPFINNQIENYTIYSIDAERFFNNTLNSTTSTQHFEFTLGKFNWDFTIWKTDLKAQNYVLRTGNEQISQAHMPGKTSTYKGYVNSDKKNSVRINIRDNHIEGIINIKGETYAIQTINVLEPNNTSSNVVIYNSKDLIKSSNSFCGTKKLENNIRKYEYLKEKNSQPTNTFTEKYRCTEIAIACDYSFQQAAGGIIPAETRLLDIFNFVQGYYDDLKIDYTVVEIFVSTNTSNNTWVNHADADVLLNNFSAWTGFTQSYDVASLYTSVNFSSGGQSGVIGKAWISGVCQDSRKYNVMEYYAPWGNNLSRHAVDQAHEMGHNWSANHDDGSAGKPNCSYCIMTPALSGTNTTWSTQSIESILSYKGSAACLTDGKCSIVDPPAIDFFADNLLGCDSLIVQFTDNSENVPTSWVWDFGDGTPTSGLQNPIHTYTDTGDYTVKLTASNIIGPNTDSLTQLISVGTGDAYPSIKGGPVDNTFAGGVNYSGISDTRGLLFDVLKPCVLESVKVYGVGGKKRLVEILDAVNGNVLYSKNTRIFPGERLVNIGLYLDPGTQYFIKITGTEINLYWNNAGGTAYPYDIGDLISITNSNVTSNYYYYFYDWEVREQGCTTTLGINEATYLAGIELFPNPATDMLNFKLPANNSEKFDILILDNTGRTVLNKEVENNSSNTTINISSLAKGVYIAKIIDAHNNSAVFKVIKK